MIAGTSFVIALSTGSIAGYGIATGQLLWTQPLDAEQLLAADGDHVYVPAGDALHAVAADTGIVSWRAPLGGPLTAPPIAHAGWVITAVAGEVIARRGADGAIVWRQRVGPVEFRPAIDGDLLVVSVVEGAVLGLDIGSGAVRWRSALGATPAEPFAVGGRVYVGTIDKWFHTLDAGSGRSESRLRVGAVLRGRAAADDRYVYFAAMDNVLWAVDRGDGAIEWRQGLPYRPAGGPVLMGGLVLVPGYVDGLPVFDALVRKQVGRIAFPARLVALPVAAAGDLRLVIGITGTLQNEWTAVAFEPALVRPIAPAALTALPGQAVPLPFPIPPTN